MKHLPPSKAESSFLGSLFNGPKYFSHCQQLLISNLPSVQHDNKAVNPPNHLSKIIQSNSCRNSLDISDLRHYWGVGGGGGGILPTSRENAPATCIHKGEKSRRKPVAGITEELTWAGPCPRNAAACRMEKWPWEVIGCFEFHLDSSTPCIKSYMMTRWQCFLDNCVGLDNWHIIAVGKLLVSKWNRNNCQSAHF